ncbi:MAG TPA: hypothetical protein VGM05_22135, partial [Planctomycetaceae bacterium]
WLAAGNGSLELLKKTIGEVKTAGPKHGLVIDLMLKLGPYVEVLNNYYARNPAAPTLVKKIDDGKKKGAAKASEPKKIEPFISSAELRKIAINVFKQGKDTFTFTLGREEKTVKAHLKFEEGLIRFIGTTLSKFVKENLED